MKTQEDLYLEYARCITMTREYNEKRGTDVKPWECVRTNTGYVFSNHPQFNNNRVDNYTFALTILEGKPVFVGDSVFDKETGEECIVSGYDTDSISWHRYSLTPPTKKRTFMLGGKELPCPEKNGEHVFDISIRSSKTNPAFESFYFNDQKDLITFYNCVREYLTEARDKE